MCVTLCVCAKKWKLTAAYIQSLGVSGATFNQIQQCCKIHDECYDNCGQQQDTCDDNMYSCVSDACSSEGFFVRSKCSFFRIQFRAVFASPVGWTYYSKVRSDNHCDPFVKKLPMRDDDDIDYIYDYFDDYDNGYDYDYDEQQNMYGHY